MVRKEDIPACQALGKKIMLSVGGATYTEGGFSSPSEAISAADNIWEIFGPKTPGSTALRPFGSAVVDGFDFDFEAVVQNTAPFANQLRSLMNAATGINGKHYYLSAVPQCLYPDPFDDGMLNNGVSFDFVYVQFYNNHDCGLNTFADSTAQNKFDFSTWDNWARTVSANRNVKVFIGAPGNVGAAGSGYVSAAALGPIISYSKQFSSFGGIMLWDMSQAYSNPGFLDTIASELGNSNSPKLSFTNSTTTFTIQPPSTTTLAFDDTCITQWGQCGGIGYNGSTICASPFTCVEWSKWWSQCE